ncbi:MAG: hypothetical protein ACRCZI_00795 [Cetobacterium sp.]
MEASRPIDLVKPDTKPRPKNLQQNKKLLFFARFDSPASLSIWVNKRAEEIELFSIEPLENNRYELWYYKKIEF